MVCSNLRSRRPAAHHVAITSRAQSGTVKQFAGGRIRACYRDRMKQPSEGDSYGLNLRGEDASLELELRAEDLLALSRSRNADQEIAAYQP